jgi:hypothetical protein
MMHIDELSPEALPYPRRWLAVVAAASLLIPAACGGDDGSRIDGTPTEAACMTGGAVLTGVESQPEAEQLQDLLCKTFNQILLTATDRYQSQDEIKGTDEGKGLVDEEGYSFTYDDERNDHAVTVTFGLADGGDPDLTNPLDVVVIPTSEVSMNIEDVQTSWVIKWDKGAGILSFTVRRPRENGRFEEYGWNSRDQLPVGPLGPGLDATAEIIFAWEALNQVFPTA